MKIILIVFSILIILLYSLPLIRAKINIGNIFGIMTGILLLSFGIFFDNIKTLCETKSYRILCIRRFGNNFLHGIFYYSFENNNLRKMHKAERKNRDRTRMQSKGHGTYKSVNVKMQSGI